MDCLSQDESKLGNIRKMGGDVRQKLSSRYEYVKCDLCGKDDTKKILEAKDLYNKMPGIFNVVQCQNCALCTQIHVPILQFASLRGRKLETDSYSWASD